MTLPEYVDFDLVIEAGLVGQRCLRGCGEGPMGVLDSLGMKFFQPFGSFGCHI